MEHYGNLLEVGNLQAISGTFSQSLTISGVPVSTGTGGSGLTELVNDLSPQLGGDLDTNSYNIVSGGNSLSIEITGPGSSLNLLNQEDQGVINILANGIDGQIAISSTLGTSVDGEVTFNDVPSWAGTPTAPAHLANKAYVDASGGGQKAILGTTEQITVVTGTSTIVVALESKVATTTFSGSTVEVGSGNLDLLSGYIDLTRASSTAVGSENAIGKGTNSRNNYNVPTGAVHDFTINNTPVARVAGAHAPTGVTGGFLMIDTVHGTTLVSGTSLQVGAGPLRFVDNTSALSTVHGITRVASQGVLINAPTGEEVRLTINGGAALRAGAGVPTAGSPTGYVSSDTVSGTNVVVGSTVSAQGGAFSNSLTVSGVPVNIGSQITITGTGGLSFTHNQVSPASTWSITHNLSTLTPQVIVYNAANEVIQPNTASGVSTSQYQLTFNTALDGKAFFTTAGGVFDTAAYIRANGSVPFTGSQSLDNNALTNVSTLTATSIIGTTISGTTLQTGSGGLGVLTGAIDLGNAGLGSAARPHIGQTSGNIIISVATGQEIRLQHNGSTASVRVGQGTPTAAVGTGFVSASTISGTTGSFGGVASAQTVSASASLTVSGVPVPLLATPHSFTSYGGPNYIQPGGIVLASGISQIPLPVGHFGSTLGRTYRVTGAVGMTSNVAGNAGSSINYQWGPNGNGGENQIGNANWLVPGNTVSAGGQTCMFGPKHFTVTSGTTAKFGALIGANASFTILGNNTETYVLIELVG